MASGDRIPVLISFSGHGGVERMVLNLVRGLAAADHGVDLLVVRERSAPQALPAAVRVVPLGARHTATAVPALARYLRRHRPAVLLAAKDRAIRAAVAARALARTRTRIVGRLGTHLTASLAHRGALHRAPRLALVRAFYRGVDHIVAVSDGVAEDTRTVTGLPHERISVVRNPVWTPELETRAAQRLEHRWFPVEGTPVIVASGRLTYQKDFTTLLRAFARVRAERACRLLILGEGRDRRPLEALAERLGVSRDVSLPGFVEDPHPFVARASLFVLSSRWEGSPNALTEALALGVPVVAADCPSGPREILQDGRYGPLVPVGDVEALAQAMAETLARPPPREMLQQAARPYTLERSVAGYLAALGLARPPAKASGAD